MIRNKTQQQIIIDLTGPDGNAYALMGYAARFGSRLGLDVKKIHEEMMAGDYEHLVETFDRYFGDCVILER